MPKLQPDHVEKLLRGLLAPRGVTATTTGDIAVHGDTRRGLVNDDAELVAVVGADLPFAHSSGAALGMFPAGAVEDAGDEPNATWLEYYGEVANVLSRAVNEAHPQRLRIDPGLAHAEDALDGVVGGHEPVLVEVEIAGYPTGVVGFWMPS